MQGFIIAAVSALGLVTLWVAILPLIAQPGPVTSHPAISKDLFRGGKHYRIDQTCAVKLAKKITVEQPKRDAAAVADRPCHPGPQTCPEIGAGTEADLRAAGIPQGIPKSPR